MPKLAKYRLLTTEILIVDYDMAEKTTIEVTRELQERLYAVAGPGRTYEEALREYLPDEVLNGD